MSDKSSTALAYAVRVIDGGQLILTNSNFKDTLGFHAQNAAINMEGGLIEWILNALPAFGEKTDVSLAHVNIGITKDNLNVKELGIVSGWGAMVQMSESLVTFNEVGSFVTRFEGRYRLDKMDIKAKGDKGRATGYVNV
ncbi:hypothetical protein [Bartonella rattaustraliani]|uniref:hypothetical protein n=1 Tax=Bartonella rattaustraliani TaxID=481139 RepID=UPI000373F82E|nr:hypothetical protein [Bartonella rattaustraliani]